MSKKVMGLIISMFLCLPLAGAAQDGGTSIGFDIWTKAVLKTPLGDILLHWKEVGQDTFSGDEVISGYFYADPNDFAYGNLYNPEVFVKVYIDSNGWANIAFNHVTVDPVAVYSAYQYAGTPHQSSVVSLENRLEEHQYNVVTNPLNNIYVTESFDYNRNVFYTSDRFSISKQLLFKGQDNNQIYWNLWNGGTNPSEINYPMEWNSDYFDNFNVSVDTFHQQGEGSYGLIICINRDKFINFMIDNTGYYIVSQYDNGYQPGINWTRSVLFNKNQPENKLSFEKEGDCFRFYINDTEVERLVLDGFSSGGGVGVAASDSCSVSFDNFKISSPLNPSPATDFPEYSVKEQNEFIYKVMTASYFWYDQVPAVDLDLYTSPQTLLDDLMYNQIDRWSYMISREEYESYFEDGTYIGIGYGSKYDLNNDLRVKYVFKDSPADLAGMQRGDQILEINGKTIEQINGDDLWDTIMGADQEGIEMHLKLKKSDGQIKTLQMQKSVVTINTVMHHAVIEIDQKKIGHLVFNKFLAPSQDELDTVFADFKNKGINELILDLRYNGGGRLSIANHLSSLIGGRYIKDKVFSKNIHNQNYQDWNYTYNFKEPDNAVSLERVVIITTSSTASASETVINGLKPFVDVILIGTATTGKPCGMYGYNFGDQHISPIEFEVVNALEQGGYYQGIQPDCLASDDLSKPFSDQDEASLRAALHYLTTAACLPDTDASTFKLRKKSQKELKLKGFRAEIDAF